MKIKLLAFGITRDIVGVREQEYTISNISTIEELRIVLNNNYPKLSKLSSLAIACNEEYASDNTVLEEGMVVALIPPVSGG